MVACNVRVHDLTDLKVITCTGTLAFSGLILFSSILTAS